MIWACSRGVQGVAAAPPACQIESVPPSAAHDPAHLDALYRDALRLADQARGWFDGAGRTRRNSLDPAAQASVATESLRVTARLAAAMAWLVDGGRGAPPVWLGDPAPPLPAALAGTPGAAIAEGSRALAAGLAALAAPTQPVSLGDGGGLWR